MPLVDFDRLEIVADSIPKNDFLEILQMALDDLNKFATEIDFAKESNSDLRPTLHRLRGFSKQFFLNTCADTSHILLVLARPLAPEELEELRASLSATQAALREHQWRHSS
jgi:hypothetical protein